MGIIKTGACTREMRRGRVGVTTAYSKIAAPQKG
jgi:hypothetical protein